MFSDPSRQVAVAFGGVSKRYGNGVLALDSLSFALPTGTRTCLLGPNGAGKTTVVRLIRGAIAPSSGSVDVEGIAPRLGIPGVGVLPQQPGMYPDLSVKDFIDLVERLHGSSLAQLVDLLGLATFRNVALSELSGGYQRRLALATALAGGPRLLILDEPTVGLDALAAHEIRRYVKDLMAGRTVLLCTHNLTEAEELCEDVLILRDGRLVHRSSVAELRGLRPPRVIVSCVESPAEVIRVLQLSGLTARPDRQGVSVDVEAGRSDDSQVLRILVGAGFHVRECTMQRPSLEEMFVDLVRADPKVPIP